VDAGRPAPVSAPEAAVAGVLRRVEPALPWAWAAATALIWAGVGAAAWRLARQRRRWAHATVAGEAVLVSDALGPAVAGVVRPRIVLPRWTLAWAEPLQRMIVRHEREHVAAGDPALLLAGLCAAALMPWNPAVWWQLGRLRLAVEVDCDARTLRACGDVATYGRLLLEVGGRGPGSRVPLAAFSEPRSSLEWRIRAMTDRIPRRRALRLAGWATLGAAAVVCIAALPVPPSLVVLPPVARAAAADTSQPMLLNAAEVRRELSAEYPPLLRAAGIEGMAVLRFAIDAEGVPGPAELVRASHPAFGEAAQRVVAHSRWRTGGGSATITLPFAFQLSRGEAAVPPNRVAIVPSGEPGGVLQLDAVDQQPELLNRNDVWRLLEQGYPPMLRDAGVTGQVVVSLVVGADGAVHAPAVVSASHDAFREPALAAVAAMRFRPARKEGRAVPVRIRLPIEFQLSTADARD